MARYTSLLYTPTISASSGVATGQVLSATETIGSSEAGVLESIKMYNLDDGTRGVTLYLLGSSGSVGAESANFAPSDTVAATILTQIVFSSGDYVDLANSKAIFKSAIAGDTGLGLWSENAASATDAVLYAAITVNSTGTKFTASGIKFRFDFRHD